MPRRTGWVIGLVAGVLLGGLGSSTNGHTPIASRFTYNEHLFPIFERQCGSCHIDGGVAPMSLLTYQEAFPWTQSIREEVLGLRMPPWKAEDGFGEFLNGHVLPAHELDMILEWSSGGYPEGPRDQRPTPPSLSETWTLGTPSLDLTLSEPFLIDSGTSELIRYFSVPTALDIDGWITGIDILPGSRAVVRHVSVYIDDTGQASAADAADPMPGFDTGFDAGRPIAVWWPGQNLVKLDSVGYALPAGADLVVRVLYKKTWITEGQAFTDQTRLGVHLANEAVDTITHAVVNSPDQATTRELRFSYTIDDDVTLLGLLPEVAVAATELQVEGVLPDGSREPLLLIREPDPGWPTRYWFDAPHALPSGSAIEVTATLRGGSDRQTVPSLFSSTAPVRLLLDYTTGAAAVN
ncbi:MAG: hypothetical protein CL462_12875 [Acidimicrobiaceae bacterium]|nr:hypothetical protein [Acidimicrobiaceae bacterium]